ncbi:MAG: NUDIX domain-containing protein [Candidatus Saccharimonadales bacterium]
MTKLDLYTDEYSAKRAQSPYGISAGGVVFKETDDKLEFLLLGRIVDGGTSYHLPKGTLYLGETLEACAIREIREEAGVNVTLKTYIGGKQASFEYEGKLSDKTIHYYVAEYTSDAEPMDNEHDFREWVSYEQAVEKLSTNKKREDIFVTRCMDYLKNHG